LANNGKGGQSVLAQILEYLKENIKAKTPFRKGKWIKEIGTS